MISYGALFVPSFPSSDEPLDSVIADEKTSWVSSLCCLCCSNFLLSCLILLRDFAISFKTLSIINQSSSLQAMKNYPYFLIYYLLYYICPVNNKNRFSSEGHTILFENKRARSAIDLAP